MEQENIQFHIAEYTLLRQELMQNLKDSYNSVIYAILANSALIAWIAASVGQVNQKNLLGLAACLPPCVSVASWLLYSFRRRAIGRIADYCVLLEEKLAVDGLGWQQFYRARRQKASYVKTSVIFNAVCMLHTSLTLYFMYFIMATL